LQPLAKKGKTEASEAKEVKDTQNKLWTAASCNTVVEQSLDIPQVFNGFIQTFGVCGTADEKAEGHHG
jgi:hypothetical protein